jgi:four helix bundle protein
MTPQELRDRTARFAADVAHFSRPLFSTPELRNTADQLDRSASAIAANYRSAIRARSRAEFRSGICIVLEEADEASFWLEHLIEVSPRDHTSAMKLLREARELVAIFAATRRTLEQKGKDRPREGPERVPEASFE